MASITTPFNTAETQSKPTSSDTSWASVCAWLLMKTQWLDAKAPSDGGVIDDESARIYGRGIVGFEHVTSSTVWTVQAVQ